MLLLYTTTNTANDSICLIYYKLVCVFFYFIIGV